MKDSFPLQSAGPGVFPHRIAGLIEAWDALKGVPYKQELPPEGRPLQPGTAGRVEPRDGAEPRDGQRFLVNISAEDENSAPITVVLNWDAPSKK